MLSSKITDTFRITIPKAIRKILDLTIGDQITYTITKNNKVIITKNKQSPLDLAYLKSIESTLSEWNGANDDKDFRNL